ncbi:hypothetical protein [Paenochrobactrum pullorum]|uniref:hypothetical protein n=1 Tax=Paenochrobactrum pullorum TaxID=1324351 RepID=UPI0035BC629A
MAAPRNPLGKAKLEGRDTKDPQRFKSRKEPKISADIGMPPKWMNADQAKVWRLFWKELPWLNGSHRALLEIATTIRTRIIANEEVGVQALNLLRQCLGQMGATPADATKVSFPDGEEEKDDLVD